MNQSGLEWAHSVFSTTCVEPTWSREPSIELIKAVLVHHIEGSTRGSLDVDFLAQGALNKVYKVVETKTQKTYAMRVALPVDPHHKTSAEVATMEFLATKTSLPVPNIYAYCTTSNNPLGFEWVLMSFIPGISLQSCLHLLSLEEKKVIVKQIVRYQAELFAHQFMGIGSLRSTLNSFEVSRISDLSFWWYRRVHDRMSKGPFNTTKDWKTAELRLMLKEAQEAHETERLERSAAWNPAMLPQLKHSFNDEAQLARLHAKSSFSLVFANLSRIEANFDKVFEAFPPQSTNSDGHEITILAHQDLGPHNILIDPSSNKITGIIDWENVATLPLQVACELPVLLSSNCAPRHDAPDPDAYAEYNAEVDDSYHGAVYGKSDKFLRDLIEHHKTVLTAVFLNEMERVCPEWITYYEAGIRTRDFVQVMHTAEDVWSAGTIRDWLDFFEAGLEKTLDWVRWGMKLELESEDHYDTDTEDDEEDIDEDEEGNQVQHEELYT